MISRITGKIVAVNPAKVTIDVNGLGLDVIMPASNIQKIELEEHLQLEVCLFFKNETLSLYGFLEAIEKELFLILISSPGIGPISGLQIISQLSAVEIINAIKNKDADIFNSIKGIGTKTAQKLIIELQTKIKNIEPIVYNQLTAPELKTTIEDYNKSQDLISALENLGINAHIAKKLVHQTYDSTLSFQENLINCLKISKK